MTRFKRRFFFADSIDNDVVENVVEFMQLTILFVGLRFHYKRLKYTRINFLATYLHRVVD